MLVALVGHSVPTMGSTKQFGLRPVQVYIVYLSPTRPADRPRFFAVEFGLVETVARGVGILRHAYCVNTNAAIR